MSRLDTSSTHIAVKFKFKDLINNLNNNNKFILNSKFFFIVDPNDYINDYYFSFLNRNTDISDIDEHIKECDVCYIIHTICSLERSGFDRFGTNVGSYEVDLFDIEMSITEAKKFAREHLNFDYKITWINKLESIRIF